MNVLQFQFLFWIMFNTFLSNGKFIYNSFSVDKNEAKTSKNN